MRYSLSGRAALVAALALFLSVRCWADSPAELVRDALETELAGPSPRRAELLAEAVDREPSFAPARWLSGQLKWGDRWLSVDDVPAHWGDDPRRVEYRRRRLLEDRAAPNHRHLARWCAEQGLTEEAHLHWAKILQLGEDKEAHTALGLTAHEGQLLTREQYAQQQQQRKTRWLANTAWTATVRGWRDDLLRGSRAEAAAARDALGRLSDPAAIRPLAGAFLDLRKPNLLARLFVETVGRIDGPLATRALLSVANWHASPGIREAAVAQLKLRPRYAVVPLLLAGLEYPIASSYRIDVGLDGRIVRNHRIVLRSWQNDYVIHRQHEVRSRLPGGLEGRTEGIAQGLAREAQQKHEQIVRHATWSPYVRARNQALLAQVLEMPPVDDPTVWYRRWMQHREYELPLDLSRQSYEQLYRTSEYVTSCFPAGTAVSTLRGQQSIETIRVGDRVLSQHVDTGQLAYKLVYNVTIRRPSPMVEIDAGGEKLRATRGHPFWVNGRTWLMAKELEAGMVLHSLRGAVVVENVARAPSASAYNLVVGDYNSYFVGEQELLVHDNTQPVEPSVRVPGLLRK